MRLVLVRHAQTSANVDMVWHGHTDTPLTELGHEQVEALGEHFPTIMQPDVIYSSPLQRTRLTAEAIARQFSLDIKFEQRLIEYGIGEWEDMSFEKLSGELNFMSQMMADEHHTAPGGESRFEVTQRMLAAVRAITTRHPNDNVVLVTHGLAMSLLLGHWFSGDDANWSSFVPDNTSITEIKTNPPELLSFNATDHLKSDLRKRSRLMSERR